jgi:PIN domain nuclease of toxin-antitoxin system
MKVLIDTSYFLPLINIGLENFSDSLLLDLLEEDLNTLYYSTISLFELTAKGMKISMKTDNAINPKDVVRGIDAIVNDNRLHVIDYTQNTLIIETATKLREIHSDSIDCIIFACAIQKCNAIITMDSHFINKIRETKDLVKYLIEINEDFLCFINELKNPLKLKQND